MGGLERLQDDREDLNEAVGALIGVLIDIGRTGCTVTARNVRDDRGKHGDWRVTVERIKPPGGSS